MFTTSPPFWQAAASGGDPYFSSVVLLMHFDGNFTDYSPLAQSFTNSGVTTSAGGALYGESAIIGGSSPGGGGSNYVKSSVSRLDYDFTSGDFTMEGWIKPNTTPTNGGGSRPIISMANSVIVGMTLSISGNGGTGALARFDYDIGGGVQAIDSAAAGVYLTNTVWHHLAATRQGDTYRLFANGVLVSSVTTVIRGTLSARYAVVGNFDGAFSNPDGSVDEVRVTKGIARYVANFTPPSAPFPDF